MYSVSVCVSHRSLLSIINPKQRDRERDRERETETERQRDRERDRQRQRQKDRKTETDRQRQKQSDRETQRPRPKPDKERLNDSRCAAVPMPLCTTVIVTQAHYPLKDSPAARCMSVLWSEGRRKEGVEGQEG